jgi:hypothetical protein
VIPISCNDLAASECPDPNPPDRAIMIGSDEWKEFISMSGNNNNRGLICKKK